MKIGFLLPSVFASKTLYPDRIFAPLELAVHTVNGLVKQGHEVTVFSTPDFESLGKLVPGSLDYLNNNIIIHKLRNSDANDQKFRTDEVLKRNFELNTSYLAYKYALDNKLDLIHDYHDFAFIPHYLQDLTGVPTLYSIHDPLPPAGTFEYEEFKKFQNHNFVSISNSQRYSDLKLNFIDTVYHGIDLEKFEYSDQPSDYILFMGRLVPEKGLHTAINTALMLNLRLEIGAQLPDGFHESEYFKEKIKPYLSNPLIGEPGLVMGEDKLLLYKQARALLFPIEWEEPFGMVMIEAMACGVPVVAFNRGSVSEIIVDGVTGFIVEPEDSHQSSVISHQSWIIKQKGFNGFVEAVKRINEIDRLECRQHVEKKFSLEKMITGYLQIYNKILNSKL